jgi:2-methylcitrate dehydratase
MDKTLQTLADFTASLRFADVPQSVFHETKRHLLDFLGCALGAFTAEPVRAARRLATGVLGGELGGTVWGTRHLSSPDLACFSNGLMGRYLDFNDQYSGRTTGHPSDVIPAVLGAAEVAGAGGPETICGIIVGYEVFSRLCDAMDIRAHWDHVTLGAIASAAAAANTLRLPRDQAAHAISLATVSNNALGQTRCGELSDWKSGAFPNAARQGLFAALLAQEGITGPGEPFAGPQGFWAAVSKPFELDPLGGVPGPFKITEAAFKYHSACYLGLSALDAIINLRQELEAPEDIREMTVYTYRNSIETTADSPAKWRPQTRETADHSLPFMLAIGLLEGFVGPEHYVPQRYADPRILALMDRVSVREEGAYTERFPQVQTQRIEAVTATGAHLVNQVDFPKGHPENPMRDEEVLAKFRRLAASCLTAEQAEATIETVLQLENVGHLQGLFHALVVT